MTQALIPAPRRQRQVDFCTLLKARLDYTEFPASLTYTERPCLKRERGMEGGREPESQTINQVNILKLTSSL